MRRVAPSLTLLVLALASLQGSGASAQDWRGRGRVEGIVTDESGSPLAGVTVKATLPERGGATTLTSNKKGRWVLGGVAPGTWNLDFEIEGYEVHRISVPLPSESARLPLVKVALKKAGPPPEQAAAVEKAEAAYRAGRFEEARAEYEGLLAMRPDLAATIHQQIGFSYIQEKQYEKAVDHLEKVVAADPANAQIRAIAAQAALEGRLIERGRRLLAGLDEAQITSPDVFFNMGVNFYNAGEVDDAVAYFGKAVALDAGYVDAYYRRGLARLGQGQAAEAKADFQKVVELQASGEMAAMARKALEQLQ